MRWKYLALAVVLAALTGAATYRRGATSSTEACPLPPSPREIPVGAPLPPLVLISDAGKSVALASLRGVPTVLLFFRATSCPICRKQLAAFAKLAAEFRAAGVEMVAASPDSPALLARLRDELRLPMRLLSDADEQAVNVLCGGLSHCELLTDARGTVRWGAFSESWSQPPAPQALLDAARRLPRAGG